MMSKEKRRVPKLRFPGFTEDWEQRKLGDVAIITGGGTPSTNVPEYWNGDIDWYSPVEIGKNRYVSKSTRKITKLGLEKSSAKLLPIGTVLFTSRAGIGNTAILQAEGCTNQGFQSITPDSKELDTYFLYTMTPRLKRYGEVTGAGSTFVEVSGKQMEKMSLVLPSLEEQKQIGRFFRTIDDSITLHQRKLNNLKLKKKALLQKLFPKNGERYPELRFPRFTDAWEQRKLGSLAIVEMNKRIFKEQTTIKGDIPFYKIGTFGGDADSFISRELFEEYKIKYPYPNIGDILISASGSIGRTVVYNGENAYYQDSNIVWLNHNGKIDNSFLLQFYNQVKWAGLEGSTIKRLYNKNILETNIALPKIDEQRLIGKFFELVDRSITLHQRKLKHLQIQKKSLLQKLFV